MLAVLASGSVISITANGGAVRSWSQFAKKSYG